MVLRLPSALDLGEWIDGNKVEFDRKKILTQLRKCVLGSVSHLNPCEAHALSV